MQVQRCGANERWIGDTTELLIPGGRLFLAVIVDLYSRFVVGWALSAVNDRHLTIRALDMALRRRCPDAGLLHHSDQGSTYASEDYQAILAAHGITCSMSRRGNCPDGFNPSTRATVTGTTSPPGVVLGSDGTGHIEAKETSPETSGFQEWQMTAFGFVDCSACGNAGWYEVHVLLTGPGGAVGIATLYLLRDRPDMVQMSVGLRLDRPVSLATVNFPATWEVH